MELTIRVRRRKEVRKLAKKSLSHKIISLNKAKIINIPVTGHETTFLNLECLRVLKLLLITCSLRVVTVYWTL